MNLPQVFGPSPLSSATNVPIILPMMSNSVTTISYQEKHFPYTQDVAASERGEEKERKQEKVVFYY